MELRTAINALRTAAGLGPATFTDAALPGLPIRTVHLTELRAGLNAARAALGWSAMAFTDPGLATGFRIKAAHLQELRNALK
jgi:hypothetical protein